MTKLYRLTETFNHGYISTTFVYSQRALYRLLVFFHSYDKSFSYLSKRLARASRYGSSMKSLSYASAYARVDVEEVFDNE